MPCTHGPMYVKYNHFTFSHKWANDISTAQSQSPAPSPQLELFPGSNQLPGDIRYLPSAVQSEVINTEILKINSLFSKELVEAKLLPRGSSSHSLVFKTTWPLNGAKGASPVQSIAKAINGHNSLKKEVEGLYRVRYDHQVLSAASVENHHLRLGNWLT